MQSAEQTRAALAALTGTAPPPEAEEGAEEALSFAPPAGPDRLAFDALANYAVMRLLKPTYAHWLAQMAADGHAAERDEWALVQEMQRAVEGVRRRVELALSAPDARLPVLQGERAGAAKALRRVHQVMQRSINMEFTPQTTDALCFVSGAPGAWRLRLEHDNRQPYEGEGADKGADARHYYTFFLASRFADLLEALFIVARFEELVGADGYAAICAHPDYRRTGQPVALKLSWYNQAPAPGSPGPPRAPIDTHYQRWRAATALLRITLNVGPPAAVVAKLL